MTHKSITTPELFFHVREPHVSADGRRFKAGTVFARCENESTATEDPAWFMSVARCSEEDNFCRTQGRNIARRKYFRSRSRALTYVFARRPSYEDALHLYRSI